MLSAIAPALTAASVFFLALVAVRVLDRAFEEYKARYVVRSMNELSDMFLFLDPGQLFLINLAVMALLATVGFWLRGATAAVAFAVAGFFVPVGAVRFYRKRRLKRFDTQLTAALQQMANSLRAGLTLPQAIGRQSGRVPPFYSALLAAGIRGSRLGDVLGTLTLYARSVADFREAVHQSAGTCLLHSTRR